MVELVEDQVRRSWDIAPQWFGRLPKANCRVRRSRRTAPPTWRVPSTCRRPRTGERPGTYYINTHDLAGKALHQIAAVTYHEANPGHHFQIALEMEFDERPSLRRFGGLLAGSSFAEGWGLYSERLADEMGLYLDDWERLGMLAGQAHRAARLITDTGTPCLRMDARGRRSRSWSPAALLEASRRSRSTATSRCPAQALAYMVGMIEIEHARHRTEEKEGAAFDLKGFHDRILALGTTPAPGAPSRAGLAAVGLAGPEQQIVEDPPLPEDVGLVEHRARGEREGSSLALVARVEAVADEAEGRGDHAFADELGLHVREAGGRGRGGDLLRVRRRRRGGDPRRAASPRPRPPRGAPPGDGASARRTS